ncbi:MAG: hypothetical protein ACLQDQ_17950 [Myxococcaceae bacterium]
MRFVGWLMLLVCLAGAAGCTGSAGCNNCVTNIDSGCPTCVPDGGHFSVFIVDPTFFSPPDGGVYGSGQSSVTGYETIPLFQMAINPVNGNIGIAYVEYSLDQTDNKPDLDPSVENMDILFVEWANGQIVIGPEKVTGTGVGTASLPVAAQDFVGVSLDYQANGEPAVAYNGWAQQLPQYGYDALAGGPSADGGTRSNQAYWFQHNAVVSYRNGGTWTQETAAMDSEQAAASSPECAADGSCSMGTIVGLYPALFVDSSETILAYRDVHFGSSTGTGDFDNSNLDLAFGGPTNWQYTGLAWGKPGILLPSGCVGQTRTPWGNHNKFIHGANNTPALISDIGGNEYNTPGTNLIFFEQNTTGGWNCPVSLIKVGTTDPPNMQTQTGPSMAYDGLGAGYAVAVSDLSGTGAAYYKYCLPGADCTQVANWSLFQPVFQSGTGGYFSSVALNPDTHDPWVAYYFCSASSGYNEFSCPTAERSLQVATTISTSPGQWNPATATTETVDTQGAWQTQMLYLTNPTRLVIGYRDPTTGAMKLAVEIPQ